MNIIEVIWCAIFGSMLRLISLSGVMGLFAACIAYLFTKFDSSVLDHVKGIAATISGIVFFAYGLRNFVIEYKCCHASIESSLSLEEALACVARAMEAKHDEFEVLQQSQQRRQIISKCIDNASCFLEARWTFVETGYLDQLARFIGMQVRLRRDHSTDTTAVQIPYTVTATGSRRKTYGILADTTMMMENKIRSRERELENAHWETTAEGKEARRDFHEHLGSALADQGLNEKAIVQYSKAIS
jgi:hypothetical protein